MKTGVVNILAKSLKNTYKFHFVSNVAGKMFLRINFFIHTTCSCANVQNKPNGRCYGDILNQMYILILVLLNTTISICTNTNCEKIMGDSSINWLWKLLHLENFEIDLKKLGIYFKQVLWLASWDQKLTRDSEW